MKWQFYTATFRFFAIMIFCNISRVHSGGDKKHSWHWKKTYRDSKCDFSPFKWKKMTWYFLRTNNNSVQVSLFPQAEYFQAKFRNFCSICNWASRTLSRVPLFLKPLPTRERSVTSLNVNKPKGSRSDLSLQTFELHCLRHQGGI